MYKVQTDYNYTPTKSQPNLHQRDLHRPIRLLEEVTKVFGFFIIVYRDDFRDAISRTGLILCEG